jgi:hypothetical protein
MASSSSFRAGILELTRQVAGLRLLDAASDSPGAAAASKRSRWRMPGRRS